MCVMYADVAGVCMATMSNDPRTNFHVLTSHCLCIPMSYQHTISYTYHNNRLRWCVSPHTLTSASDDRTVRIWVLGRQGDTLNTIGGTSDDGCYNTPTDTPPPTMSIPPNVKPTHCQPHCHVFTGLPTRVWECVLVHGRLLVCGCEDGSCVLWDVEMHTKLAQFRVCWGGLCMMWWWVAYDVVVGCV